MSLDLLAEKSQKAGFCINAFCGFIQTIETEKLIAFFIGPLDHKIHMK